MVVESVAVLDLRNLAACEVELGPGVNLLWGPNGAGKTNLLEATYMSLAGRSCRTRDDRETIAFGKSLARVESVVAGEQRRHFMLAVSRGEGRRHLLDGAAAGPESRALRPALAVFMPDRLALIKGPPASRRTHLDGFCAALWPAREENRRRYSRALAQRNALLARIRSGRASPSSLDAWDRELAEAALTLIADRSEAVTLLAPAFAAAAGSLGLEGETRISYRPRSRALDAGELLGELEERRAADIGRGYSGWGPHLDDVALERDERSLRRYGSQGQQRAGLLALLFAERRVLLDDGRPAPLMLLDDVTSELDSEHRRLLVAHLLEGGGQALITATERAALPAAGDRTEIAIRAGNPLAPSRAGEVAA
jgi:DNA replication and repair protein RecF